MLREQSEGGFYPHPCLGELELQVWGFMGLHSIPSTLRDRTSSSSVPDSVAWSGGYHLGVSHGSMTSMPSLLTTPPPRTMIHCLYFFQTDLSKRQITYSTSLLKLKTPLEIPAPCQGLPGPL